MYKTTLLKKHFLIFLLLLSFNALFSQYYINGKVSNDYGDKMKKVKIKILSSGQVNRTDNYGCFRVTLKKLGDSLSFSLEGYEVLITRVTSTDYLLINMKMLPAALNNRKNRLSSVVKGKTFKSPEWSKANETYRRLIENPFIASNQSDKISFTANINQASYSNVRRIINYEDMVPPDAIRIEEMLNYFNFNYSEPDSGNVFKGSSLLTSCPWNKKNHLLFVNFSSKKVVLQNEPPNNLVYLIDISGSMDKPNKLSMLKTGIGWMVKKLRPIDTVSIVTYGSTVKVVLEGVSGGEQEKIMNAMENLTSFGPTPGEAAIKQAYKVVQKRFIKGGNNRIIMASDGDFNIGITSDDELEDMINKQKKDGIYLTCLGVGMGNYKDSKLSILAQKGNGNFSYIDSDQEAEKVLVTELSQTLFSVADNVYINATINPLQVKEFRLIGYDNNRSEFTDTSSRIAGGEIGAGHAVTAIFELVLKDSALQTNTTLADIKINYRLPKDSVMQTNEFSCSNYLIPFEKADSGYRKAAAIAMFSLKLKQSPYARVSWKLLSSTAKNSFSTKVYTENEFLGLITKARKIYGRRKKYVD